MEEEIRRNEVKIDYKDVYDYSFECINLLGRYDQIILSSPIQWREKTEYIKDFIYHMGIILEKKYIGKKQDEIIWDEKTINVLNPKTGRVERKTYYKLGLSKIPQNFMYTNPDREDIILDEKLINNKFPKDRNITDEEEICDNEIKVADKEIKKYIGECIRKFKVHEEIILSVSRVYIEKGKNIINFLYPVGVSINKKYRGFGDVIKWEEYSIPLRNTNSGKIEDRTFFRIALNIDKSWMDDG